MLISCLCPHSWHGYRRADLPALLPFSNMQNAGFLMRLLIWVKQDKGVIKTRFNINFPFAYSIKHDSAVLDVRLQKDHFQD